MKSRVVRFLILGLVITGFFAGSHVRAESTPAEQKKIMSQVRVEPQMGKQVPFDLPFHDELGASVTLGSYFGTRPVIIVPVYYQCPMLCSLTLTELLNTLKAVPLNPGKDFEIVTFSINPKEKPELAAAKKANYIKSYHREGAAAGWHFLTGEESSIHALTESLGFHYAYDEKSGEYAHASSVIVATPKGLLTHYFAGLGLPPLDLRLALVEASQGKIGSLIDQAILLCYHYDPVKGKYGFVIAGVIRIAGLITIMGLIAGFIRMSKQNRQKINSTGTK